VARWEEAPSCCCLRASSTAGLDPSAARSRPVVPTLSSAHGTSYAFRDRRATILAARTSPGGTVDIKYKDQGWRRRSPRARRACCSPTSRADLPDGERPALNKGGRPRVVKGLSALRRPGEGLTLHRLLDALAESRGVSTPAIGVAPTHALGRARARSYGPSTPRGGLAADRAPSSRASSRRRRAWMTALSAGPSEVLAGLRSTAGPMRS